MSTEKFYRVNEKIKFSPIILIDSDGKNLGSIPLFKAKDLALNKGLDLVEVSPNSRPPVCKIMDFGKFKYEQEVKEKKGKNVKKTSQTKEIRLSSGIADHDMETKCKSTVKFLQSGHKVQVRLELKRRDDNHRAFGKAVLGKFLEKVFDFGKPLKDPSIDGKFLFCLLEPKIK